MYTVEYIVNILSVAECLVYMFKKTITQDEHFMKIFIVSSSPAYLLWSFLLLNFNAI